MSLLRSVWEHWKRVARKLGDLQARGLLMGFYFVVLFPFALAVRWGSDPLTMKPGPRRGWRRRSDGGSPREQASKQF